MKFAIKTITAAVIVATTFTAAAADLSLAQAAYQHADRYASTTIATAGAARTVAAADLHSAQQTAAYAAPSTPHAQPVSRPYLDGHWNAPPLDLQAHRPAAADLGTGHTRIL